jgi:putative DNA primase/helicase
MRAYPLSGWGKSAGEELKVLYKEVFGYKEKAAAGQKLSSDLCQPTGGLELPPESVLEPKDSRLIARGKALYGERFQNLWDGDHSQYETHSQADLALCNYLAFLAGCDGVEVDRLFRHSGLMRLKWDEKHHADSRTYGQVTIETAIIGVQESLEARHRVIKAPAAGFSTNDIGNG